MYGWNNGIMGNWTTWFLDFNEHGTLNRHGGAKFGPRLINMVAEIRVVGGKFSEN